MFWLILALIPLQADSVPRFDPTALLQNILIPADAAVGSIIYRLRASDPTISYPLIFKLPNEPTTTVSIDSLNCTRLNSLCQSNVVLRKRLEIGRYYDFVVDVVNQRGESASMNCSFRATNATTPIAEIFPSAPTLLKVSEKARRNTELGVIIARGSPQKAKGVVLELWGSPQFGLHQRFIADGQTQGTILLLSPLDYEQRTVHHLTVLANDPYTELEKDTRNIASWPLLVAVLDEQDTPPIFTLAPPITTLSPTLQPGDVVLRVHAEDGDRGQPREVRYGLVPENDTFTRFFNISEDTGELRLIRPLNEILSVTHGGQPILVTVIAEEVRANPQEPPAQSSTVRLALIPPGITAGSPTFGANEYNTLLDENSPTGTVLDLPQAEIITQPGDVVTLMLENHNDTFEISPTIVEGHSSFQIRVHDPKLLDYERWHSVECYIVAKEFNSGNYTTKVKLKVLLNDVNDNDPEFTQSKYRGSIQEHAKIGTIVLRVEATDIDREPGSKIRYTKLIGPGSDFFNLDPLTGVITVANSVALDAEEMSLLAFTVEAADEDGNGRTATASVIIELIDINDEAPQFERKVYEFILNHQKDGFTNDAFIKAIDRDISLPNNEVHYELITPVDNLMLNEYSGEFRISNTLDLSRVLVLKARAWDGGVPRLSDECEVRIYPPEGQSRKMIFIVPGSNPDRENVKSTLRALTGARVTIDDIQPYTGHIPGATEVTKGDSGERSVVYATVSYAKDAVVDIKRIQDLIDQEHTSSTTTVKAATPVRNGGSLLWLLILLILLALIVAIILILCCICQGCPLYVPPKRRKIVSSEIQKLVRGSGHGKESKSVQVAEWFGRKEAWSPEHVVVDHEIDSLRRHEVERGSDRVEARRTIHRQAQIQREPSREQLYIREGNADILRLITRGNEPTRPITLVADQAYMNDSGKEILMRRYIDQQQSEVPKAQVILPNSVQKLQTEHELLEQSLRQQNALLRQILIERERDLRLETQSLPAGTQTDQDMGTQTEPEHFRPPRRKVRSDNDASDYSDDELTIIREKAKRRSGHKSNRTTHLRRKIKTPIQEESEIETIEQPERTKSKTKPVHIKQTRTSELRQKRANEETRSKSALRKEVLKEISASLDRSGDSYSDEEIVGKDRREYFSEDSLEDPSPRYEETTDSSKQRYHSESDLRMISAQSHSKKSIKSQSHLDLSKINSEQSSERTIGAPKKKPVKRTSRYMEWYEKNKNPNKTPKSNQQNIPAKPKTSTKAKEDEAVKEMTKKIEGVTSRLRQETESSQRKRVDNKKTSAGPNHPLVQHSEYRYEPPVRRTEEDVDSGIALTRPAMAQKKSVFTIAYDDMHTSQLRANSSSP